jgi:hypothetical protein
MGSNDPESLALTTEIGNSSPLIGIPYPNSLILPTTQYQILSLVEKRSRCIVEVSTTRIDLPGFGLGHTPDLDESVVACRHEEGEFWVEGDPVYTAVVTFEDIFYGGVRVAKDVCCLGVVLLKTSLEHLFFEGGDGVLRGRVFFAKTRIVPDPAPRQHYHSRFLSLPDRLIKRGRADQVVFWMPRRTHYLQSE